MDMNKLEKTLNAYKGDLTTTNDKALDFAQQYLGTAGYGAFVQLFSSKEQAREVVKAIKTYSKVEGDTYAEAVFNIIQNAGENQPQFTLDDGSKLYRPLTFKENMVARIEQPELFDEYLDSCTGVAYKKKSSLVKIQPICKELITIDKNFNNAYLDVDYSSFEGEELNTEKTSKMDKWLVAMGGVNAENKEIYNDYQKVLFERRPNLKREYAMNFYTVDNPSKDQLRALYVNLGNDDYNSNADGYDLNLNARLLRLD